MPSKTNSMWPRVASFWWHITQDVSRLFVKMEVGGTSFVKKYIWKTKHQCLFWGIVTRLLQMILRRCCEQHHEGTSFRSKGWSLHLTTTFFFPHNAMIKLWCYYSSFIVWLPNSLVTWPIASRPVIRTTKSECKLRLAEFFKRIITL